MTGATGRPARGRRNNGLDAREFVALGDLDPRVGEHLLDVLAIARIAAFLQPSADFNPIVRSTVLPSRPTDRLWVDREHADDARALIAQVQTEAADPAQQSQQARAGRRVEEPDDLGDLGELESLEQLDELDGTGPRDSENDDTEEHDLGIDIDAAWQEIVAGYNAPAGASLPSWPAIEDADPSTERSGSTGPLARADHLRPLGPPALGPRDHTLAEPSDDDFLDDTDDEGYTPPPPPPMPRPSSHAVVAVLAVVVGFMLFFRPSLLPIEPTATMVLGVLGVLGGAATLVYRLRDGLGSDDDPDDGAVV